MSAPYTYTFIRRDIPVVNQLVQIAHASLEAGFIFQKPTEISCLIVCEVESEIELSKVGDMLDWRGIEYYKFFEPDNDMGYTAICTRPILSNSERNFFQRFKLYQSVTSSVD